MERSFYSTGVWLAKSAALFSFDLCRCGREVTSTQPVIAVLVEFASQVLKAVRKVMPGAIIAAEVRDMHPAHVGKGLHVANADHDGLAMVTADSNASLEDDILSSLPAKLTLRLSFVWADELVF
jgi:hypothetical protein